MGLAFLLFVKTAGAIQDLNSPPQQREGVGSTFAELRSAYKSDSLFFSSTLQPSSFKPATNLPSASVQSKAAPPQT